MYENDLENLIVYAKELGFKVVKLPKGKSIINYRCKCIELSFEHGNLNALYTLSHELGHAQQFLEKKHIEYSTWGGHMRYMNKIRNHPYKVVIHEYDAWLKGLGILKELSIDTRGFYKVASFSLYTYITKTKRENINRKESWMLCLETIIRLWIIKHRLHKEEKGVVLHGTHVSKRI